jgi:hypothetical protein
MFRKFRHYFIPFFLFFSLSLASGQEINQQKPEAACNALLWKIEGNHLKKPSYLYGMIETNQKFAFHLIDSFFIAIRTVDQLVLETHPDSVEMAYRNTKIIKRMYEIRDIDFSYQPTSDYYSLLSPQPMDEDLFASVLSGMAADPYNFFGASDDSEEELSLTDFVYNAFYKLHKKVAGLISVSEQLDQEEIEEKYNNEKIRKYSNERTNYSENHETIEKAVEAYRRGDLDGFDSLYRRYINDSAYFAVCKAPYYHLLAKRLDSLLQRPNSALALIPVFALPGEQGIIAYLRSKGYTVTPVKHHIITKPNHQKDKIDKIQGRVEFGEYTSRTGIWSARVPKDAIVRLEESGNVQTFTDRMNNVDYTVSRIPTHAMLSGKSPEDLFQKMDSVFIEYVPGKIIRRKELQVCGYPAVDVLNRTSRGNLEMFRLIITPIEIIVFKVSGKKSYIRKHHVGSQFIRSTMLNTGAGRDWVSVKSEKGDFSMTLPPYYIADTALQNAFPVTEAEFQAWDQASRSWFLLKRNVHHDLGILEEDTFDLHMMAEEMAREKELEISLDKTGSHQGYPSLEFTTWTKDQRDTLYQKIIIAGSRHYLLAVRSTDLAMRQKFFDGFTVLQPVYTPSQDTVVDTLLSFRVISEVRQMENASKNDDDQYLYMYLYDDVPEKAELKKREKSHLPVVKTVSYFYPSGSEYIRVEKIKIHDYKGFASYSALWDAVSKKSVSDSTLVINYVKSDSLAEVPFCEITYSYPGTIRYIRKKIMLHKGVLFVLTTMQDRLTGELPWSSTFFGTFTPLSDTMQGRSPFEDKGWLFITNFLSADTIRVKQAMQSLDMIVFRAIHRDSLLYILKMKDLLSRNMKVSTQLIAGFGKIDHPDIVHDLQQLYDLYEGCPVLQNAVFLSLGSQKSTKALEAILRILAKDPPLPSDEGAFNMLMKPLQLSVAASPNYITELLRYDRYPEYRRLIHSVLLSLVENGSFNPQQSAEVYAHIRDLIVQEMKRNNEMIQDDPVSLEKKKHAGTYSSGEGISTNVHITSWYPDDNDESKEEDDDYALKKDSVQVDVYSDISDLMMLVRIVYPSAMLKEPRWITGIADRILTGNEKNDALDMTIYLLKHKVAVPDSIIKSFVSDLRIRSDFYKKLCNEKLLKSIDTGWVSPLSITESMMYVNALWTRDELYFNIYMYSDEEEEAPACDDSLTFLERRFISTPKKNGYIYFYKYKGGYGDEKNWMIGVTGIQPEDSLQVNPVSDFNFSDLERIFAGDDTREVIDKLVREKFRKLYRKRFPAINPYVDFADEFYFDE